MSEPSVIPDDPRIIVDQIAATAKQVVTDSAQVALDVFAATNGKKADGTPSQLTSSQAIQALTTLAGIAWKGAIDMARVPLQTPPDRRTLVLGDYMASVVSRAVTQATTVVGEASEQSAKNMDAKSNTVDPQLWVDTGVKLASIAVLRGAEIVQTAVAGPAPFVSPIRPFDPAAQPFAPDPVNDRLLTVATLDFQGGPQNGQQPPSIANRTWFAESATVVKRPAGYFLLKNTTAFDLVVNTTGLPSGIYMGTVVVKGDQPGQDVTVGVTISL